MKSAIYTAELGSWHSGAWIVVTTNPQGDGHVTLSNPDRTVRSMQPDGSWETRPEGTAAAYELATIDGGTVSYWPTPDSAVRVFPFKATVPNS